MLNSIVIKMLNANGLGVNYAINAFAMLDSKEMAINALNRKSLAYR